jgi:hypothetical protein
MSVAEATLKQRLTITGSLEIKNTLPPSTDEATLKQRLTIKCSLQMQK